MKIRGQLLSAVAVVLAVGAAIVACGSSSSGNLAASALGQSCTRTSDCASGLVCLANVCFTAPAATVASDAGATGDAASDAATAATGPHLGQIGESCQTTKDCTAGLDCITSSAGSVCDIVSYGLTATGKTCTGECNAAADCCEVPTNIGDLYYLPDGGFSYQDVPIHGCQDILTALGGDATVCNSLDGGPSGNTYTKESCFYYQTYCLCAANTWSCSAAHRCQYTAPCSTAFATNTLGGCPTNTRSGATLGGATCNMTTNSCLAASCATAADCTGKAVADVSGATCAGGDCTCVPQSGCYLKCTKDLDCAAGSTCDTTTSLCAAAACTTNTNCVAQTNDVRAVCSSGACKIPCTTDHDCGASGDVPGTSFSQQVCGTGGFCQALGCSSDSDCLSSNVHVFCVTPPAPMEHSAITN